MVDCDVRDGQAYIVMEHLEGESVADYLERIGGLVGDTAFALAVLAQVAQAVGAAHAAGIVHRDLKPDNVFLSINNADDAATTAWIAPRARRHPDRRDVLGSGR